MKKALLFPLLFLTFCKLPRWQRFALDARVTVELPGQLHTLNPFKVRMVKHPERMKRWVLILLLCSGCYNASTLLTDAERRKVIKAAGQTGAGYGANYIGQALLDTVGMRAVWITPTYTLFQRPADSLAYGLVPLLDGVTYTVSKGAGLIRVEFTTLDRTDGYKLKACMEQLYGPLTGANPSMGQRGNVLAQVVSYSDGGTAVTLASTDSTKRLF